MTLDRKPGSVKHWWEEGPLKLQFPVGVISVWDRCGSGAGVQWAGGTTLFSLILSATQSPRVRLAPPWTASSLCFTAALTV